MPIQINFLAEQQAQEEARRRDPVKRATWVAAVWIGLLLMWGGYLQIQLWGVNGHRRSHEAKFDQIKARHHLAQTNLATVHESQRRLNALKELASERLLWANCLDALQFATLNGVQLTQLRGSQAYTITPSTPPKTNDTGAILTPGKPAVSRERTVITIEATDSGTPPGEQITAFQDTLRKHPFFRANLGEIRLIGRSPVQADLAQGTRPFVKFELECVFAEQDRLQP
jgi:cell division protein FtsB